MFRRVDDEFGRVDALVNNAGIAGGYGTIDVVDAAMMARLLAVNVTGAFLCAREAVARMSTAHGGSGGAIVNVSSKAAVLGGAREWVHYAATKGAIDTMTVGLARELAPCGVRVNGVRPGLIESDFHDHAPPGRLERMAPAIPMRARRHSRRRSPRRSSGCSVPRPPTSPAPRSTSPAVADVRALVLLAHPNPDSFSHAVAARVVSTFARPRTRRRPPRPLRRGVPRRDDRRRARRLRDRPAGARSAGGRRTSPTCAEPTRWCSSTRRGGARCPPS